MAYVTDLRHYLYNDGEIVADMLSEARQLASFLALIVDEASGFVQSKADELNVRCLSEGCPAQIVAYREENCDIVWFCPLCEQNGVIRNWQGTKRERIQS